MKKKVFLVLAILLGLVLVSGVSYAFFTVIINGNDTAKENIVVTGDMELTYTDGEEINLNGAFPGDSVSKTFTVKNTGTLTTTYNIKLVDVVNTFVDKSDLVYTLIGNNNVEISKEVIPDSINNYLVDNIVIDPNVTHAYTLTITFNKTNDNQNDNQGVSFSGKINIDTGDPRYNDETGAPMPELYQGLIPVTYDESGNVIVADIYSEWYDYAKHNWANAVLVNNDDPEISSKYFNNKTIKKNIAGTIIPMEDILQMYVWVPRYKYKLWNAENGTSDEQAIEIVFEANDTPKSNGKMNGTWLTHPAFTFGNTELNGIWVGKFEPSNGTLTNSNDLTNIQVKPNVVSMADISISEAFYGTRNIELKYASRYNLNPSEIDTHIMKNMEWGAVAYLTNSIYGRYNKDKITCVESGCNVLKNPVYVGSGCGADGDASLAACGGAITGCSAKSLESVMIANMTSCIIGYSWNEKGGYAATTGNIYGIYDMSGGTWNMVMGFTSTQENEFNFSKSGFETIPDEKYFDKYDYNNLSENYLHGKLGDGTREILKNNDAVENIWFKSNSNFPYDDYSWFYRGGSYGSTPSIFIFDAGDAGKNSHHSFYTVITAEDK